MEGLGSLEAWCSCASGNSASEIISTGVRRKLARPVQPKQQLSHDVITDITLILNTTSASLAEIRFLFILLVGYAGVFRITKILSLRVKDITILDDFMKINLIKRKNDQYRNGHISVLAMSRKPIYTCPVGITKDFFLCYPIPNNSCHQVVRRIVQSKFSKKFHKSLGMSNSTALSNFTYISPLACMAPIALELEELTTRGFGLLTLSLLTDM